jgi:uncharacterized protein GlcG (DUF336 family)
MTALSLDVATTMIDTALAAGRKAKLGALTVVVLDPGGHVVALKREDGSGILRPEIAMGKAWGALGMGISSRAIQDRLGARPVFLGALASASGGRMIPVPGGVLVKDQGGAIIGAVGVTGDTSDADEYCAIAGINAAALAADPAEPQDNWAG